MQNKKHLVRHVARRVTCGAREVRVDDLLSVRVEVHEHPEDVFAGVDCVPLGAYNTVHTLVYGLH